MLVADLKKTIRQVPDFPRAGITFYDVTTLFRNAEAFRTATDTLVERFRGEAIDAVAGIESRGFVLAAAGSAIGLGNIWRFPIEAANNGGLAFLLVYLACVFFIAMPVMMADREGAQTPVVEKVFGQRHPWEAKASRLGVRATGSP